MHSRSVAAAATAATLAALTVPLAAQDGPDSILEEVGRAAVVFFSGFGIEGRCSISDQLLDEEIVRVMRRYQIPIEPTPPVPDPETDGPGASEWLRTPVLNVSVIGVQADRAGRGCAMYVSTELSVPRPWIPSGSEDLIGLVDEDDLEGRLTEILRILMVPGRLTASSRGTLLIAPRDERDRDVQRAVETQVSEIAEAISRTR